MSIVCSPIAYMYCKHGLIMEFITIWGVFRRPFVPETKLCSVSSSNQMNLNRLIYQNPTGCENMDVMQPVKVQMA